jgi:hypothetical protein
MSDDFYTPHRPPAPRRVPEHGEPGFMFLHGPDRYLCELRDHAEVYGVEAQFWKNEDFFYSRRFDARLDRTRTPRELAIAWAEEERKIIEAEKGGD